MSIRPNGQPVLLASDMYPSKVRITEDETRVACPFCDRWQGLGRGRAGGRLLKPHSTMPELKDRCLGSGQAVEVDLTPEEWLRRHDEAIRDAARIRGSRVHRKPVPPTATPLHRMARCR